LVPSQAPRIPGSLLAALDRVDDASLPIAEVYRRVGVVAEALGFPRPSYEQIRVHIHERRRRPPDPSTGEVLLDILTRARAPNALADHMAGIQLPRLR
jgi:hypothetical protein